MRGARKSSRVREQSKGKDHFRGISEEVTLTLSPEQGGAHLCKIWEESFAGGWNGKAHGPSMGGRGRCD